MAGWTNRGKKRILEHEYRRTTLPTNYYIALVTSAAAPGPDTNLMSELTEIAAGNGYTSGGYQLTPNATDFDTLTEDDTGDIAEILIKDVEWVATGGPLPASGNGARYAVLLDDNGTIGSREVYHYWSLVSDRSVAEDSPLRLINLTIRATEPA